jgi:transposase InsO family protein
MRKAGLKPVWKPKFVSTTDSKHDLPVAQNLLARHFNPPQVNQAWTSDITYLRTQTGGLYLMKQLAIPLSWQKTPTKWLVMAAVME